MKTTRSKRTFFFELIDVSMSKFFWDYFTFAMISFAQNTSHSSAERDPSPFSSISENTLFLSSGVG